MYDILVFSARATCRHSFSWSPDHLGQTHLAATFPAQRHHTGYKSLFACLCVWVFMHFFLLVFIRTCLPSEWPLFTIKRWNIPEYFQQWLLTDHTCANIHKHVKTNTEYHTKITDPVCKPYLHYLSNFGVGMILNSLLLYVYQCCIYLKKKVHWKQ